MWTGSDQFLFDFALLLPLERVKTSCNLHLHFEMQAFGAVTQSRRWPRAPQVHPHQRHCYLIISLSSHEGAPARATGMQNILEYEAGSCADQMWTWMQFLPP